MNLTADAKRALGGAAALMAVIVGYVLHHHYSAVNRVCNSGIGRLGQAFSSTAQRDCSTSSAVAGFGMFLLIVGLIALGGCAIGLTLGRSRSQTERWKKPIPPEQP